VGVATVVRGLEWELEGKWGGNNGDKVKTKKEGENCHDRHAVLYLGFTLTVLERQRGTIFFAIVRNSPSGREATTDVQTSIVSDPAAVLCLRNDELGLCHPKISLHDPTSLRNLKRNMCNNWSL